MYNNFLRNREEGILLKNNGLDVFIKNAIENVTV